MVQASHSYRSRLDWFDVLILGFISYLYLRFFQYKINEPDYQEQMRNMTRLGDEIEFVSAVIRISEDANILREERITYSINNLLSDIGGDLGLFLGLCVWSIIHSAMNAVLVIQNKILNCWSKKKLGTKEGHLPTPSRSFVNSVYCQPSPAKNIECHDSNVNKNNLNRDSLTV